MLMALGFSLYAQVRQLCGGMASGSILPKPGYQRARPRLPSNSPQDTPSDVVSTVTHTPGNLPSFFDKLPNVEEVDHALKNLKNRHSHGKASRSFAADGPGH